MDLTQIPYLRNDKCYHTIIKGSVHIPLKKVNHCREIILNGPIYILDLYMDLYIRRALWSSG